MTQGQKQELGPIEDRAYRFALRVIKLVRVMPGDVISTVLGRQVLRAVMSVGANAEEAIAASSKRDFANKMNIIDSGVSGKLCIMPC